MRLLLTLTTAHALLHSVKLGGPSPAAWFQDTLGIGTDGDAVCFDDGFRLRFDAAAEPTPCKLGCLGVGVELPTAEALAKAGGDAERRELTASSLPDEDAEKTETLWDVAALADPQSRRVWAGFAASKDAPAPAQPAAKVVLKVKDLPAAIEFYTTGLGMTLLRQRALVPDEAALAAYVGFSDDDAGPESGASGAARPRAALRLRLGEGRARRRDQRRGRPGVVRDPRRHHGRHGRQPGGRVPAHGPGRPRGPRRRGRGAVVSIIRAADGSGSG